MRRAAPPPAERSAPAFAHMLLTGASSGLGAALTRVAARPGALLSLAGRDAARLAESARAAEAAGAAVRLSVFDVRDHGALAAWVEAAEAARPIDLVVANAGVLHGHRAAERLESAEEIAEQIEVNLTAAMVLLNAAAAPMIARRRGRLAAISSLAGVQPLADEPAYSAAKAGLNAYAEALREYLAPHQVGVTLAAPGYLATPMGEGFLGGRPMEISAERAASEIWRALCAGRDACAPPWPLAAAARLGRLAPWRLRARLTRRLRYRFDAD